ncbi:putative chromosome-partitioning protein ParB [Gemmata sp. SH-PL17]|uniref:ParB/RepB/Spo0J family partition protein n=1 Tax=Gemmata sp. SH-PL17 TaxID=1630693 RepID=UPI00078DF54C|nr:ParB/RepB/Spo0J family partition protein [Gemmata sp. SH-PL17]AMV24088.1 putative chromosome-partitioning protein ParB [Gemmata sp. SH-PL17]
MTALLKNVLVSLCVYLSQPRSKLDPEYCRRLGESMRLHGQKVPVIGYTDGARFVICDGGCRLEGARLAGLTEVLALDLGKEPTRAELLLTQASIDQHRQNLPPIDRANLFRAIRDENQWTARQLAESVRVSEAQVSRALALLGLPPEVQSLVNEGELDASKAYLITQEPDPAKQIELAGLARVTSRAEFEDHLRKPVLTSAPAVRLARVKLALPSGSAVSISGAELTMENVVQILAETLKEARRATEARFDVKTWQRMMADRSKARAEGDHV